MIKIDMLFVVAMLMVWGTSQALKNKHRTEKLEARVLMLEAKIKEARDK